MMRFKLQPEPAGWDVRCRQRGRKWLRKHPGYDRPYDYWSEFEPELCSAFRHMCAYCVMVVMKANMDHFVPVAHLKETRTDELAYEWSNFRYGEGVLNQRKSGHVVLDPFKVNDDWFEMYRQRKLSLDGLCEVAPLIARAVERDARAGKEWRQLLPRANPSPSRG